MAENMSESAEAIARDLAAIGRIDAVPRILKVLCQTTGMGFAAVARVTDSSWTACAVQDDIEFGLKPGSQLGIDTTLCKEAREARAPIVIDHASVDPVYGDHATPRLYGLESYISVPIVLADGVYFGNLCAVDPRPAKVSEPRIVELFMLFADLISAQLGHERRQEVETVGLREAVALREQLMAVLGHDLRNPLAAIQARSTMLQRVEDRVTRHHAAAIAGSARRMKGLIEGVLDLARGRRGGGIDVEFVRVDDIGPALAAVVGELQAAHLTRVVVAEILCSEVVYCDRGRIEQLASNLLSNALTHGDRHGAVRFSVLADADSLVLTVHNVGDPIPPENLDKIFSPFWRSPGSTHTKGLGLGLFICAQIVKAHGGVLDVTSTREQGTTFVARLPRLHPAGPLPATALAT